MIPVPRRLRTAVLGAMLPSPGPGLPGADDLALDAFWATFDEKAPIHLQVGFAASVVALGSVAPRVFGFGAALPDLTPDERDAVLTRAAESLAFVPLVEIAKVVVGLAYFADARVEAAFRSPS